MVYDKPNRTVGFVRQTRWPALFIKYAEDRSLIQRIYPLHFIRMSHNFICGKECHPTSPFTNGLVFIVNILKDTVMLIATNKSSCQCNKQCNITNS